MSTLLQVNASIHNSHGQSSQLANQFVATFHVRFPEAKIIVRDVAAAEPVPHLTAERFGAFITKPEERSAAQHAVVAYSDALINELKQADLGMNDVEFVYAEGLAISLQSKEAALAKARAEIARLAA